MVRKNEGVTGAGVVVTTAVHDVAVADRVVVEVIAVVVVVDRTTAAIFRELLVGLPQPSPTKVNVAYFFSFFAFLAAFFSWFFIVFDLTRTAQATTVADPATGWAGGKGGSVDSSCSFGGVLLRSLVLDDLAFLRLPFSSSASAWSSSAAVALTRSACLASLSAEA